VRMTLNESWGRVASLFSLFGVSMPKGEKNYISMFSGICKGRAQAYHVFLLGFHLSLMLVLLSSILLNSVYVVLLYVWYETMWIYDIVMVKTSCMVYLLSLSSLYLLLVSLVQYCYFLFFITCTCY
jgi:hypothetical protein